MIYKGLCTLVCILSVVVLLWYVIYITPPRYLIPPPVFPLVYVNTFVYLTCISYLNFETDYSSVPWPFHCTLVCVFIMVVQLCFVIDTVQYKCTGITPILTGLCTLVYVLRIVTLLYCVDTWHLLHT
jgi:hypothetical protein